jgi:hypothetical protein
LPPFFVTHCGNTLTVRPLFHIGSRKLKCTSETTGCTRCRRDGIPCHYSSQKPKGRPRRKKEDPSPQPLNAYYNSSNGDNGIAPPSNSSGNFTAFSQEKPQSQIFITAEIPASTTSPSDSTTSTNTTTSQYESPSHDQFRGCVYGDPAMLISDIRYNLVPPDILRSNLDKVPS